MQKILLVFDSDFNRNAKVAIGVKTIERCYKTDIINYAKFYHDMGKVFETNSAQILQYIKDTIPDVDIQYCDDYSYDLITLSEMWYKVKKFIKEYFQKEIIS